MTHVKVLSAIALLVASGASRGEAPPEVRARVAAALALATLERVSPESSPEKVRTNSGVIIPARECPLGVPDCPCGCLQGESCRCRVLEQQPVYRTAPAPCGVMVPTYQPYRPIYQPAYQPVRQFQPRTVFRANCGPGG